MLDSPTVLSTSDQISASSMSPLAIQQASPPLKLVSSPPANFHRNISVVDLNNKETSSILLLMMQQQQQKQQQNQQLVNKQSPLASNSQVFPISPYSSNSSSIPTSPMISPKSPMSILSQSPTSNSLNSSRFFKIVNLASPTSNKPSVSLKFISLLLFIVSF